MKQYNRKELEIEAYNIIKSDMQYIGAPEANIVAELKNATDNDLINFIFESR